MSTGVRRQKDKPQSRHDVGCFVRCLEVTTRSSSIFRWSDGVGSDKNRSGPEVGQQRLVTVEGEVQDCGSFVCFDGSGLCVPFPSCVFLLSPFGLTAKMTLMESRWRRSHPSFFATLA